MCGIWQLPHKTGQESESLLHVSGTSEEPFPKYTPTFSVSDTSTVVVEKEPFPKYTSLRLAELVVAVVVEEEPFPKYT